MSLPAFNSARPNVSYPPTECIILGFGAGFVGVGVMTLAEKVKQAITHCPNSNLPGKTLAGLLGVSEGSYATNFNLAMRWGQGILVAGARGLMPYYGIAEPLASCMFMGLRLCIDQILETGAGVGGLRWSRPVGEQIIDLMHRAIFVGVTGYVADKFIIGEAVTA